MELRRALCECFSQYGIEYWAVIDLKYLTVTKAYLLDRVGIKEGSALIFLAPYYSGECENLSRYAAARDYHIFISEVGKSVGKILEENGAKSAAFGDHSPIDERDAAAKSGLGIIGDNGLIINEKYGSYVFIGEVVTDAPADSLGGVVPTRVEFCEHCGACAAACPRGEIGECLSSLTQKKGELSERERSAILKYGMAWGCDICAEVCPHNKDAKITPIPFFKESLTRKLDTESLLSMSEEKFKERAYSWRGKATVLRNLEILESPHPCKENGAK